MVDTSVCKYIQQRKAEKSKKPKDVFVKQYYEPGEECEFDWGEVKLRIGGKPVTLVRNGSATESVDSHIGTAVSWLRRVGGIFLSL